MISIYNEALNKWEIKTDTMSEDIEQFKKALDKAALPSSLKFRKPAYVSRETKQPTGEQLKTAELNYEQLRREALPHCFSKAFLEATNTRPAHSTVYQLLRQGQSPYEVIEQLTDRLEALQQEIESMIKAQSVIDNF